MADKTQLRRDIGKGLLFGFLSVVLGIMISQQHQNAVEDDNKTTTLDASNNASNIAIKAYSNQLAKLDWLSGNPLPPLTAEANLSQADMELFANMRKQHGIALALTGDVRGSAAELFDQGKYSECVQFIDGLPKQNKVDLSDLRARAYLKDLLVGYDKVVPESAQEKSELIDRLKEALDLLTKPNRTSGEKALADQVSTKIDELQESLK